MSKKPRPVGGRAWNAHTKFKLSAGERIRALFGGEISVKAAILLTPGQDVPTQFSKEVFTPKWWPW